jgi:hypothetical protein
MRTALAIIAALVAPFAFRPLTVDQGGAYGVYVRCSHAGQRPFVAYDKEAKSWLVACEPGGAP